MGNALTDWIEGKDFILSPTFSTILNIDDFVSWHNDVKSLFPEKLFGTEYYLGQLLFLLI